MEHVPGIPKRIGANRPMPGGPVTMNNAGQWSVVDDRRVWFFQLEVPDAAAVRVHFSQCDLPASAQLLVYGAGKNVPDVYGDRGPAGKGEFWAAAVPGRVVYVEYQAPRDERRQPRLEIDEISHIYDDSFAAAVGTPSPGDSAQDGVVVPMYLMACERDVTCYSGHYSCGQTTQTCAPGSPQHAGETCAQDSYCNHTCVDGVCPAGSPRDGQACNRDSDCSYFACIGGVCPSGSPQAGQACAYDADCNRYDCTYFACAGNVCSAGSPRSGQACTQDRDCNGVCAANSARTGALCADPSECSPVQPAARDAVGLMQYTVAGYSYACSGSLLADNDPNTYAGYFLTANHCISSQSAADSMTVYWLYQSHDCDGAFPSLEDVPKSIGGTLLATNTSSDFTFIRLADDPRDGQGFAAWTDADVNSGDPVVGIHHPQGSFKRVSFGSLNAPGVQPICSISGYPETHYWYLDWNTIGTTSVGIVEPVSSGSPLFNRNWQVVGQLYGACVNSGKSVACDNPADYNSFYGKFGVTLPSIASWLNLVTLDDGYEDNDTLGQSTPICRGIHNLRLVDFDDYFSIESKSAGQVSATATYSVSDMTVLLQLLQPDGTVISQSNTGSGTESVSENLAAGSYRIRAHKVSRWGGDYTLTIVLPPSYSDFDVDGDVDMDDFGRLQRCYTGADVQTDPDCFDALLDGDNRVDASDIAVFQSCYSGPNVPALNGCTPLDP